MGINFDSIISNTKGSANIAKLKVTLGLKTNELSKAYVELGKAFYDCTKNNQVEDGEAVGEDNTSSSMIDFMANEKIQACLETIRNLEKEITALEEQVSNEKGNMKPISTPDPMQPQYNQTNYSQQTQPGIQCPKCGFVQSPENGFCINCGSKIGE